MPSVFICWRNGATVLETDPHTSATEPAIGPWILVVCCRSACCFSQSLSAMALMSLASETIITLLSMPLKLFYIHPFFFCFSSFCSYIYFFFMFLYFYSGPLILLLHGTPWSRGTTTECTLQAHQQRCRCVFTRFLKLHPIQQNEWT